MKRFVCLLFGLSLLAFTGCPMQPSPVPSPSSGTDNGSKQVVSPGTTSPITQFETPTTETLKDPFASTEVLKPLEELGGQSFPEFPEKSNTVDPFASTEAPKPEEPKVEEAPKPEEPKVEEAPKPEESKVEEAPKPEEPKVEEAPKPEEPKVEEAPKPEEPKVDKLLGDTTGKPQEILDIIKNYKTKRAFDSEKNAARKPKVYTQFSAEFHNPDGMTISDKTGTLFLSNPNFNRRPENKGAKIHPAYLVKINSDGTVEKLLTFEEVEGIQVGTKQIGPMGLDFGPDGHLYVCDNQYFFDTTNKSRILRVLMDGDKPTGKVEVAVEGIKLANAILWLEDKVLLTDTSLDLEGEFGSGCVWKFGKDEILQAGSGENPPIRLNPLKKVEDDPHCVTIQTVKKIPGGGNGGADGITADSNGVVYFGNFGNGEIYRIIFDAEGKAAVDVIHPAGEYFHCCDGIYFDKGTNKVYVTDSASNAVHAFAPPKEGEKVAFETIWEGGNTDGADGSLDQPCEAVVIGKKLILANFDWPFLELLNTASDDPSTLSVIELE